MPQQPPNPLTSEIAVELKFFIGTKAIAAFLEASLDTTRKWLRKGVLPAKKDPMGRWVMTNLDYYQSLT